MAGAQRGDGDAPGGARGDSRDRDRDDERTIEIAFTLNGSAIEVRVDPSERLLDMLRYRLRLTGTKEGCGEGECGACTVYLDGLPVNSCLIPAWQVRGRSVETIESIDPASLGPFVRGGATQCGACTPGVVMTASWLRAHPEVVVRFGARMLMAGNLCRCTGYDGIVESLAAALAEDRERRDERGACDDDTSAEERPCES